MYSLSSRLIMYFLVILKFVRCMKAWGLGRSDMVFVPAVPQVRYVEDEVYIGVAEFGESNLNKQAAAT